MVIFFSKNEGYLFLTNKFQRYNEKRFNVILKRGCEQIGLEKYITIQSFRATINNLRKEMNCPLEDRKLLLGHALNDVNVQFYTDLNIKNHRAIADRWNPYKDMDF